MLILAEHWTPYLENLHVCMTDATFYESHLRFPTDTKLLCARSGNVCTDDDEAIQYLPIRVWYQ